MSLDAPITVRQEAILIRDRLAAWTADRGADVKVMANERHVWEEVATASGEDRPRILIVYTGEQARGSFQHQDDLHRVDRQWRVIIIRGHGFSNQLTDGASDQTLVPDAEAYYDALESLRDAIRVALDISEEFPVNYRSMRPLPNVAPGQGANVFMDAMLIEFSTANDIPQVWLEEPTS